VVIFLYGNISVLSNFAFCVRYVHFVHFFLSFYQESVLILCRIHPKAFLGFTHIWHSFVLHVIEFHYEHVVCTGVRTYLLNSEQ
jgi:hypothetical protein